MGIAGGEECFYGVLLLLRAFPVPFVPPPPSHGRAVKPPQPGVVLWRSRARRRRKQTAAWDKPASKYSPCFPSPFLAANTRGRLCLPCPRPRSNPGIPRTKCGTKKGRLWPLIRKWFEKDNVLPLGLVTPESLLKNLSKDANMSQEMVLPLIFMECVDSRRLRWSMTQDSDTLAVSVCLGMASLPTLSIQMLNGLNAPIKPWIESAPSQGLIKPWSLQKKLKLQHSNRLASLGSTDTRQQQEQLGRRTKNVKMSKRSWDGSWDGGAGWVKASRDDAGLWQGAELAERSCCISSCRHGLAGGLQGGPGSCGCRGNRSRASFPAAGCLGSAPCAGHCQVPLKHPLRKQLRLRNESSAWGELSSSCGGQKTTAVN